MGGLPNLGRKCRRKSIGDDAAASPVTSAIGRVKPARDFGALDTEFGNGGDLAKGAASNRTQRIQPFRRVAVGADDDGLIVHIQPKPERVRPGEAAIQQAADQRMADAGIVAGRSRAVDDPGRRQLPLLRATVRRYDWNETGRCRAKGAQPAALERQPAFRYQLVQDTRHLRRHAMTVDIPVGAEMAQETAALIVGQTTPKTAQMRAQVFGGRAV
jgi:hypothetical protein